MDKFNTAELRCNYCDRMRTLSCRGNNPGVKEKIIKSARSAGWKIIFQSGYIKEAICPSCQKRLQDGKD